MPRPGAQQIPARVKRLEVPHGAHDRSDVVNWCSEPVLETRTRCVRRSTARGFLFVVERRSFAFRQVFFSLFSPPVSFRLAVLRPCIHSSCLRATGYRVQTRPEGTRRAAQSVFRSLMTNAVTGPTRQLSLALQKLSAG